MSAQDAKDKKMKDEKAMATTGKDAKAEMERPKMPKM